MMKYLPLLFFLCACATYPDNFLEEYVEDQIKELTCIDIDFTAEEE